MIVVWFRRKYTCFDGVIMEGDQEIRGFLTLLVYNPVMIVIGEIFKSTQVV